MGTTKSDKPHGFAVCNAVEIENGKIPEWAQVLKEGSYYVVSMQQVVDFTPALLSALADRFKRDSADLPLDYEHAIMAWVIDPKTHARPDAEGWFDQVEYRPGDGLYGHLKSVTPEASARIERRNLKYLSAGILWAAPDLRTGARSPKLVSVSLTLFPNIYDMKPLAASATGELEDQPEHERTRKMEKIIAILNSVFGLSLAATTDEAGVVETIKGLAERVPAKLSAALGHADAKPMDITAALSAVSALKSERIPATLSAILGTDNVDAAVKAVATMQGKDAQAASLAAIQNDLAAMKAEKVASYLDAAVAIGKIVPAQRDRYAALLAANEKLGREIIDGLPSTGLMAITGAHGAAPVLGMALSATDDEIAFVAQNAGGDAAKLKERMVKNG
jgi:hypothetical protein